MARLPRLYAPDTVQYILQRPVAGRSLVVDADDYALLAGLLEEAVRAHGVAVHAFVLLPDEFRLLATPPDAGSIAAAMQAIGRRYVPFLNRRSGASGALWDRRYRSTLVDPDAWLLPSMRHVEHRPVGLGHAADPATWRWSSEGHHAGRRQEAWLTDHPAYWALGNTPFERQAAYRALASSAFDDGACRTIDAAIERGWVLGSDAYAARIASAVNRRSTPLRRGRKPLGSVPN